MVWMCNGTYWSDEFFDLTNNKITEIFERIKPRDVTQMKWKTLIIILISSIFLAGPVLASSSYSSHLVPTPTQDVAISEAEYRAFEAALIEYRDDGKADQKAINNLMLNGLMLSSPSGSPTDAELTRAKGYFNQVLALDPNHVDAWLYLGFCDYRLTDYDSAMESFAKALELDPGNEMTHNLLQAAKVTKTRESFLAETGRTEEYEQYQQWRDEMSGANSVPLSVTTGIISVLLSMVLVIRGGNSGGER